MQNIRTDPSVQTNAAASATSAVRIRGLVKTFGDYTAVNHIDLDIRRGEIFGVDVAREPGRENHQLIARLQGSSPSLASSRCFGKSANGASSPPSWSASSAHW